MKVILKQEVDNLGLAGDVVDVADGYGRNYLLPRGLAIQATKGAMRQAEILTRTRKAQEAETVGDAEQFRTALESRTYRIAARVDDRGHLYGSVSAADIDAILKERGHDIERRRIDLRRPLKELGTYTVPVRVHPQVTAEIELEIVDVEGKVVPGGLPAEEDVTLEERALAAAEAVEGEEGEEDEQAGEDEQPGETSSETTAAPQPPSEQPAAAEEAVPAGETTAAP